MSVLAKQFWNDDLTDASRDFFRDAFGSNWQITQPSGIRHHQSEDDLSVSFDVPGVTKEELEATVYNGLVTVKADTTDRNYLYRIRVRNVNTEAVVHTLENGVLTLSFPLAESAKEHNILGNPKKEKK